MNAAIAQAFRAQGLFLRGDAAAVLHESLQSLYEENRESFSSTLLGLAKVIKDRLGKSDEKLVDRDVVRALVRKPSMIFKRHAFQVTAVLDHLGEESESKASPSMEVVRVVDAFDTPRFLYNATRKVFVPVEHRRPLHGAPADKMEVLRERFVLLHQRTIRSEAFAPPVSKSAASKRNNLEITPIESLKGSPGRKFVMGILSQLVEGRWFLEDLSGSLPIELSEAAYPEGLFTETAIVLAEGQLKDDTFHVQAMGFPPAESRESTLAHYPQLDLLGLETKAERARERAMLDKHLEQHCSSDMVIILSDVHLDRPSVLSRLAILLKGFADCPQPLTFVLMGNFTQRPLGSTAGDATKFRGYFDALADVIAKVPTIAKKSRFVLMPGPHDPGFGNILPRPGIPAFFTQRIRDKVPGAVFASNPCRLLYSGMEYVIFREDLVAKMRRNCLLRPDLTSHGELSEHLTKTVIDQAHLCPLPMTLRPVYWNYDHALRLYPLPHVLILADSSQPYDWTYEGTQTVNPGPFHKDFSFVVHYPAQFKAEFSRVDGPPAPDEESR